MRHALLVSLSSLFVACGPAHLGGSIDGDGVGGARDAFYDTVGVDLGPLGEYELLIVLVTDFADGCEVFEEISNTLEPACDERCDDYLDIAETYHLRSDRFWSTTFSVNTSDGVDRTFDYDTDLGDGEFTTSFSGWDGAPLQDAAACEEACEDGDLLAPEVDDGDDGELELEEDGDLIRGRFDVSFGGDDGLSGSFAAHPCDMGDWVPFF